MDKRQEQTARLPAGEEAALTEVIRAARVIQRFLWGHTDGSWGFEEWKRMFRKRVAKLDVISADNPHAAVEIKKRLLQTAALSVALIAIIEARGVAWDALEEIPSNLPDYADRVLDQIGEPEPTP